VTKPGSGRRRTDRFNYGEESLAYSIWEGRRANTKRDRIGKRVGEVRRCKRLLGEGKKEPRSRDRKKKKRGEEEKREILIHVL